MTKEEYGKIEKAFVTVANTEYGRVIIEYLKRTFWINDDMMNINNIDEKSLIAKEAQRGVVLHILRMMEKKEKT